MNPSVAAIQGRSNGTRAGSHWPEILAAVEDRSVQPAEFVRLILMEMSLVCHELQTLSGHSSLEFKLKPLLAELHALRTLAETTRYATELAVQTDNNLDELKFQYISAELFKIFEDSVDASSCGQLIEETIFKFLKLNMERREPEILLEIKKIC